MRNSESGRTRLSSICAELAKYGIDAEPSAANPSWLVIHAPSAGLNQAEVLLGAGEPAGLYVSDEELLRSDCAKLVLGRVGALVGYPC